jgi:glycerate dehydrogenase
VSASEHTRGAVDSAPPPRFGRMVVLDSATIDPGDNPWDGIEAFGPLEIHARTPRDLVAERARGAEVVLTNKTVLGAAELDALPDLRLVCVLATGVNVVDLDAARRRGVVVCNVPGYSLEAVPQHTFALILEATNAVGEHAEAVREGEWARAPDFSMWKRPLVELAGKTIGLVGHGLIGSKVGEIAHAFGMKVLAFTPSRRSPGRYGGFAWATVDEIFASADVVSLHCPLTAQNARFAGARLFATMREGSLFVNTARGDLVDEPALARALDAGRPWMAALDVLSAEPPPSDHPLANHPRCIVTPHIAWASLAARQRLMQTTAANIRAFANGRPQNVVT